MGDQEGDLLRECETLLREKRYGAFTRTLNRAVRQFGPTADSCRLTAAYCEATDRPDGLLPALLAWASLAPDDPEPLLRMADTLWRSRAAEKALEAIDLAERAGATPLQVAGRRMQVYFGCGRFGQARQAADAVSDGCGPGSGEAMLADAWVSLAGNLEVAAGRDDLHEMVGAVAARVGLLQVEAGGLRVCRDGTVKQLGRLPDVEGVFHEKFKEMKATPCGSVLGTASLLHMVDSLRQIQDGSFWGSRNRVYVIEPDEDLMTLALASCDVREALADPAVTWLTGPSAVERLRQLLRQRCNEPPVNFTATSYAVVKEAVDAAGQEAEGNLRTWYQQAADYYASLPPAHWADVFGESPSRQPRVMLITTEFSSYLKFATRDVARPFERMGWDVRVVRETEPTERVGSLMVGRLVAEFRPDLIWQINFTRSNWPGVIPDGVPFVCWDQDNMQHMLSREQGARMGRFDFLAHLGSGAGYIRRYGYPPSQLVHMPMCVDRDVFRPEPDDRPDTDVCYVSHHGWTPDQRIDTLLAEVEAGDVELLRRILDAYVARLEARFADTGEPITRDQSAGVLQEAGQRIGMSLSGPKVDTLADCLYRIVANAIWRQQVVRWVAGCGVRLRLYGQGWDRTPEFAPYAAGIVEHGRPLRHVLASSRIALQAVLAGNEHQRLFEAASCGVPVLMRYHPGDEAFTVIRGWIERLEKGAGRPIDEVLRLEGGGSSAEQFSLRAIQALAPDGILSEEVLVGVRRIGQTLSVRDKLGGIYDEVCFRNRADLREKIGRILRDEPYRRRLAEHFLAAAEHHDYAVQVPRVVREIGNRLAAR